MKKVTIVSGVKNKKIQDLVYRFNHITWEEAVQDYFLDSKVIQRKLIDMIEILINLSLILSSINLL